ncbi:sodium-dependent transporter [Spartinivicinus poritis]|uniref:Transporter n=1 Tax=Spartinivicinus poritis TaxID=2994640 RepID=A0ABT5UBP3_9GAMM|nr:sodium-dependent transporter [Spartinivicinus sp. A2-2]MDE1463792.1 sodium-dependent transporter [Spartinivicinus sp. A2-2]
MSGSNSTLTAGASLDATATPSSGRLQWSTRLSFILAATGSAIGLGNIWKFPYITGENGGGAFVLVYLACILVIGIPLMMAEIMIGRRGQQSPPNAMASLAKEAGSNSLWKIVGWAGVIAGFLILSFYTVIAGWSVSYISVAADTTFVGKSPAEIGSMFESMLNDPTRLLTWSTLVILVTLFIVGKGVKSGLEKAVNILMPCLLVLIIVMVGYAMTTGHFMQGVSFLFNPDFSKLSGESMLIALGHAFFTLSLASGAIMTYGSYLPKSVSIAKTTIYIGIVDTAVALLAGLAIFPIVFANNLEPSAGPGLIFVTLPIAFGQMPFGTIVGILFFIMLSIAALTSAISMIEPSVARLVERFKISRFKACTLLGFSLWLLSVGSALSFNLWKEEKLFGKTFFDMVDHLTANLMMPLGGLAIAIFSAWIINKKVSQEELGLGKGVMYNIWLFTMRFITPICIVIVFLNALNII